MKTPPPLHVAKADELVRDAVDRRLPVLITWRREKGWVDTAQARLLDREESNESLWITCPKEWNSVDHRPPEDGRVSVSFRRGPKTCLFDTHILTYQSRGERTSRNGFAVGLEWPTEVFERQRRLYDRVGVPAGFHIPVAIHRASENVEHPTIAPLWQGRMIDLSAGGLSVELPADQNGEVRDEDRVICTFATSTGGPRLSVFSRVRHCKRSGRGNLRLGLQFLDLDASMRGQFALKNIVSLTSRFRLM